MPRPVVGLLTFALFVLTAAPAAGDDKKKAKPPPAEAPAGKGGNQAKPAKPPAIKPGARKGDNKKPAPAPKGKANPPKHKAGAAPAKGKLRTFTTVRTPLDLVRGAPSQSGGMVGFYETGIKSRPAPAGQLVHLFFMKHEKGGKPAKLAEGMTGTDGQVTFRYRVPPNIAPGMYRIWTKYPGGSRWEPSESGRSFVTVK